MQRTHESDPRNFAPRGEFEIMLLRNTLNVTSVSAVRVGRLRVPVVTILLAGLLLSVAWYVGMANAYVSSIYRTSDARFLRNVLAAEIEELQTSLVDTTMLEELERKAGSLGFMPIKNPVYLAVPGDAVARR